MSQIVDSITRNVRKRAMHDGWANITTLNLAIDQTIELQPEGVTLAEELEVRRQSENRLFGFGQLEEYLKDASIEEIWINALDSVFIAREGVSERIPISFTQDELAALIERMLRPTGRRLDRSSPFVDASLPDGSRLHVVIPDITRSHWSVNIRKFPSSVLSLAQLCEGGVLTLNQAESLSTAVKSGANILVSGATQAGKTTMLCALLNELPNSERLVSVEETFEIRTNLPDWVALQTRQVGSEGQGEISLRRLVKESLRMRPSRLVVGEVREAEALDLLIAMNSGLPSLCTIHANSTKDALLKLSALPLLAGQNISLDFTRPMVESCIDLVVHCELRPDGKRKVVDVLKLRESKW